MSESTTHTIDGVPPGPRMPMPMQTMAMVTRQRPFLERQRRRYGSMFTLHVAGVDPLVVVADPELIKQTFRADPTVLHAGTRSPLRRVLGDNSLLGIDEDQHLEQRKLLLPPFKGQRMKAYEALIEEIAIDEVDRFPEGVEFPTGGPFQRITLRAILRAVFGATGATLRELEELMPALTDQGQFMTRWPFLQHDVGP
ncbi:MAG TPA: cytochrome P450, partial [Casimicrobiaceae bacterium]